MHNHKIAVVLYVLTKGRPFTPNILSTLSPPDLSMFTEFGPNRQRFAGVIPERLIFGPRVITILIQKTLEVLSLLRPIVHI